MKKTRHQVLSEKYSSNPIKTSLFFTSVVLDLTLCLSLSDQILTSQ
jgi:hypothetical protein